MHVASIALLRLVEKTESSKTGPLLGAFLGGVRQPASWTGRLFDEHSEASQWSECRAQVTLIGMAELRKFLGAECDGGEWCRDRSVSHVTNRQARSANRIKHLAMKVTLRTD
jgi:hypothetical protein